MLLFAVVGFALLDRSLERALRAPVDAYLTNRTLNLLQVEGTKGLSILLPHLDLDLLGRRLELRDIRIRYDRRIGDRYTRFEATAPSVLLTGLDLSDLIWHRNFRLSGVRLRAPVLRNLDEGPVDTAVSVGRVAPGAPEDTLAVVFPAPDTLLYRVVANWLPDDVRGGRIERLIVEHATFVQQRRRGADRSFDSTADLTLGLEGLQLDSTRHTVFAHGTLTFASLLHINLPAEDTVLVERGLLTVAREDTAYSVAMVRTGPGRLRHAIRVVGVARSQARNSLTIDSLIYAPRATDDEFFQHAPPRSTRIRATATAIAISDLRQGGILQRRLTPAVIRIGSLDLDVLADQRQPPGPAERRSPWPTRFLGLAWTIGADSIFLAGGSIRYGELRPAQSQAAEIVFDNLRAVIVNATNDSSRTGRRTPMVLRAHARIYGQGELAASIAVPVQRGPLRVRVSGQVGAMELAPLNQFLTVAEGIMIRKGALQQAKFSFAIAHGRANGTFTAAYRDLEVAVVNPVTGKQNFGARLKTLLAGLLTRGSTLENNRGQIVPAPIRYTLDRGDSFWGALWQALRSGIMQAVRN